MVNLNTKQQFFLGSFLLGVVLAATIKNLFYASTVKPEKQFTYKLETSNDKISFPKTPNETDLEQMISRNMFNSRGLFPRRLSEPELEAIRCAQLPPRPTTLPVKLQGTIAVWDRRYSVASIQDTSANITLPVKIGEIFNDKLEVLDIESKKVTFKPLAGCQKEYIDIPDDVVNIIVGQRSNFRTKEIAKDARVKELEPGTFSIQRSLITEALSNPMGLLNAARAEAAKKGDDIIGWKIMDITPGTLYQDLGIVDNDIITRVNGSMIQNAGAAMQEFQKLGSAKKITINVIRNGQPLTLKYNIN